MNNNTNNIDASCARSIVLAQLASDCGKCIYELGNDILTADNKLAVDKCRKFEYGIKEFHILRAIDKINCSKRGSFNYWVERTPDQNGYDSILVYFDIKMCGKRYQVSFHTPYNRASSKLKSFIGKGRKTRWAKNKLSSRETCKVLIDYYNL